MLSNVAAAHHGLGVAAFSEARFPDDDVCKQLLITFDAHILLTNAEVCRVFLLGNWELQRKLFLPPSRSWKLLETGALV